MSIQVSFDENFLRQEDRTKHKYCFRHVKMHAMEALQQLVGEILATLEYAKMSYFTLHYYQRLLRSLSSSTNARYFPFYFFKVPKFGVLP